MRGVVDQHVVTPTSIGSLSEVWRRARQPVQPTESSGLAGTQPSETECEPQAQALQAIETADAHWRSTMKTMQGPQARLRELTAAAQGNATALRQGDRAGLQRSHQPREIPANWQVPHELRQDAPRPGPASPWQALDRAFKSLVAALNDQAVALPDLAATWDALGRAAAQLADAIDNADANQRAVCSFCAKPAREVRKLITGPPGLGICNDCVELCVEVLEEQG